MIRVHVFRQRREVTDVDIDTLSEVRTEKGTVVWVDMVSPTEPELAKIAEEFSVEPGTLRECAGGHQRPKLEENGEYVLVVSSAPSSPSGPASPSCTSWTSSPDGAG